MIDPEFKLMESELEKSRQEILQLAERVKNLVAKRNEREVLIERLRRISTAPRSLRQTQELHHLCSLCAAEHSSHIEHVRGCAPGSKCDQCGGVAIMWVQLVDQP